jgi:hypothetical protein
LTDALYEVSTRALQLSPLDCPKHRHFAPVFPQTKLFITAQRAKPAAITAMSRNAFLRRGIEAFCWFSIFVSLLVTDLHQQLLETKVHE